MRKRLTLIFLLLTMGFAFGQDLSRDEVLQLITDDTCTCISEDTTLFTEGKSLNQKKRAVGLCVLKSYNSHKKKSKELSDKGLEDFESIGEEVGMLMTTMCLEDFMALFSEDQLVDFLATQLA